MRWRRMIMERVQQLQHLERDDLWVLIHMGSVSLSGGCACVGSACGSSSTFHPQEGRQCDQFRTCWLSVLLVDIYCMLSGLTGWLATVRVWWCWLWLMSLLSCLWWMFWHNRRESELVAARIEFHHVAFLCTFTQFQFAALILLQGKYCTSDGFSY